MSAHHVFYELSAQRIAKGHVVHYAGGLKTIEAVFPEPDTDMVSIKFERYSTEVTVPPCRAFPVLLKDESIRERLEVTA